MIKEYALEIKMFVPGLQKCFKLRDWSWEVVLLLSKGCHLELVAGIELQLLLIL